MGYLPYLEQPFGFQTDEARSEAKAKENIREIQKDINRKRSATG